MNNIKIEQYSFDGSMLKDHNLEFINNKLKNGYILVNLSIITHDKFSPYPKTIITLGTPENKPKRIIE